MNVSSTSTSGSSGSCFRLVPSDQETDEPYALHEAECEQEADMADYGTLAKPKVLGICQYTDCKTKDAGHCKFPFMYDSCLFYILVARKSA